jgi:hypothetical protein
MRELPITIWSPSRIFGTPVMSAASAIAGSTTIANPSSNFINMQMAVCNG